MQADSSQGVQECLWLGIKARFHNQKNVAVTKKLKLWRFVLVSLNFPNSIISPFDMIRQDAILTLHHDTNCFDILRNDGKSIRGVEAPRVRPSEMEKYVAMISVEYVAMISVIVMNNGMWRVRGNSWFVVIPLIKSYAV